MSQYEEKPCFLNGKYLPLKDANINIRTHALQYGTACFGGIRAYYNKNKDNLYIFRLKEHYNRLLNSSKILQMTMSYSYEEFENILITCLKKGEWKENAYIRPILYKSDLELSPRLHNVKDSFSVYIIPLNDYLDIEKGLNTCVSSWVRIEDNQIPTRAKATGGYINSALAKSEALQNGFDEAIFLDSGKFVSEGSASNLFLVKNNELITPDLPSSILEGITRRTVLTLAEENNIKFKERRVGRTELYTADELFFAGTGVQIAWIKTVDKRTIGEGKMGPITKKLHDQYFDIVTGKLEKYSNWLTAVYDK
ncbi:MAG: branched-chain amino acid transaminase [Spirochaetia bacterium]|nr:branched-chain amino acid transaminase [Spirochaetia bacterium]